ncbi:hypothetical protein EDC90_1001235 [Martelella mediterranea]|uniref:Uncharacterized protein n=1 Tax=Martelella mediterranea TaxID=293089 RepID=A0A4R3NXH2_9HYPH|nr:hypothetical protein EDC90_1001235 [Martelella mediterranea]
MMKHVTKNCILSVHPQNNSAQAVQTPPQAARRRNPPTGASVQHAQHAHSPREAGISAHDFFLANVPPPPEAPLPPPSATKPSLSNLMVRSGETDHTSKTQAHRALKGPAPPPPVAPKPSLSGLVKAKEAEAVKASGNEAMLNIPPEPKMPPPPPPASAKPELHSMLHSGGEAKNMSKRGLVEKHVRFDIPTDGPPEPQRLHAGDNISPFAERNAQRLSHVGDRHASIPEGKHVASHSLSRFIRSVSPARFLKNGAALIADRMPGHGKEAVGNRHTGQPMPTYQSFEERLDPDIEGIHTDFQRLQDTEIIHF